eukprot:1138948-Pelagomonas_calceolata.AAC.4
MYDVFLLGRVRRAACGRANQLWVPGRAWALEGGFGGGQGVSGEPSAKSTRAFHGNIFHPSC